MLASFDLSYSFWDNFLFTARYGFESSDESYSRYWERIAPKGNNEFAFVYDPGRVSESNIDRRKSNTDVLLSYDKAIGNFTFHLTGGANLNEDKFKRVFTEVQNIIIEGLYRFNNASERPISGNYEQIKRNIGINAMAELEYKSLLFVSFALRREWSSTLPPANNSYYYPGGDISFVFTELFPGNNVFSFGKLRAAFGKVGNDTDPYQIFSSYTQGFHSDGFGSLQYPFGEVTGYQVENLLSNPKLKPELTEEIEIGTDLRFFKNRLGLDLTLYQKNIENLIWPSPKAYSSGYRWKIENLGEMTNKGIEVLFKVNPVKKQKFRWDVTINYDKNINKLVSLSGAIDKAEIGGVGQRLFVAIPGKPVGIFEGRTIKKVTHNGKEKYWSTLLGYLSQPKMVLNTGRGTISLAQAF
ncbi:MAG: TonB-dependent receptor [Bacteroidales bacterium]|nr:TonB-dependent receptor [Bacteroidales bacterium]